MVRRRFQTDESIFKEREELKNDPRPCKGQLIWEEAKQAPSLSDSVLRLSTENYATWTLFKSLDSVSNWGASMENMTNSPLNILKSWAWSAEIRRIGWRTEAALSSGEYFTCQQAVQTMYPKMPKSNKNEWQSFVVGPVFVDTEKEAQECGRIREVYDVCWSSGDWAPKQVFRLLIVQQWEKFRKKFYIFGQKATFARASIIMRFWIGLASGKIFCKYEFWQT